MSAWRRFWRALGFGNRNTSVIRIEGGGSVQIDGVTYTVVDGEILTTNGTPGSTHKLDLGPQIERTFEAPALVSDAISLSKESAATGLRLRNFDATITVVATPEVTAPQVVITGREKLIENITARMDGTFFELTAPKQQLTMSFMMIVKMLSTKVTSWTAQPVRVVAKVPLHAPLSFKDTTGVIGATGTFGALDGTFAYNTEAVFSSVTDVTVSTGSSCNLVVSKMAGDLDAKLEYNSTLEVSAGSAGDCTIATDSSCTVTLNSLVKSLRAKLEYNTDLHVGGTMGDTSVSTDSSCTVNLTELHGTLVADLEYNSSLTVQRGHLTSVELKTDSSCTVKLTAAHVDLFDAKLEYNSTLKIGAQTKKGTVKTDSSCTVSFSSGFEWLKADLEYNSTLKIGGSVGKLTLDADSSCKVTVNGTIDTGSLKADFNTTVTAVRVGHEVNRQRMSDSSRLVTTG
jgi:hypothetical protein